MLRMDGFLVIDKAKGMTSHDVVARLRKLLGTKKIGHTGTLDPNATGVLVMAVGRATRLISFLPEEHKTYEAEVIFGLATDTDDITGLVTCEIDPGNVTRFGIDRVLPRFTGEIMQVPPLYSALKKDGKKLYDYARAGVDVEVSARPVTIHGIEIMDDSPLPERLKLRVDCAKGTYIRSLCRDLGENLGTVACMGDLRRTRSGSFTLEEALTLEELSHRLAATPIEELLTSPAETLSAYTAVTVKPESSRFLRCGNRLVQKNVIQDFGAYDDGQLLRLYDTEFCGLGRFEDGEEPSIKPVRLLI